MSQSPENEPDLATVEASEPYLQSLVRINDMINRGASLSGNERNCLFLNTGNLRFANASAVTGFDLPDDARAVASVDWDGDGDQDLWVTNRTGPRIRFLRNQITNQNKFLTIRLIGETCNRNAIGARVELRRRNNHTLVRSLRAGEGFLSQCSSQLHFGLGKNDKIESLAVRWPDGTSQTVKDVQPNHHYVLTQGESISEWKPVARHPKLENSEHGSRRMPDRSTRIHVKLSTPIEIPSLEYKSTDGSQTSVQANDRGPILVHLWAGWCQPCVTELAEWNKKLTTFPNDLRLIALNVEKLDPSTADSALASLANMASQLNERIELGFATQNGMQQIQAIHDTIVRHASIPLPMSLLLDKQGRLVAIFKGTLSAEAVTSYANGLENNSSLVDSLPFPGTWHGSKPTFRHANLLRSLLESGLVESGNSYQLQMRSALQHDTDYPTLLVKLGNALLANKRYQAAETIYKDALSLQPNLAIAQFDLGLAYEFQGKFSEARKHYERAIEIHPNHAPTLLNLGVLLSRSGKPEEGLSYVERAIKVRPKLALNHFHFGQIKRKLQQYEEAFAAFRKSHELDPSHVPTLSVLADHCEKNGDHDEAIRLYRLLIKASPNDPKPRIQLGVLLEADEPERSISLYREALQLDPNQLAASNNLAWLLATHPDDALRDKEEALRWGMVAAEGTKFSNPAILDTLAASYACNGQFKEAIATLDSAIKLAKQQEASSRLLDQLERRMILYDRATPYVQPTSN